MDDFITRLPKAELHLHLEGTVGPDQLWRLAERYHSPLEAAGREVVDRLYRSSDFGGFLNAFKTVCQHLRSPEDYEVVAYESLRRLAAQNVRYAEITVSAGVILWKGEDLPAAFEGIESGGRHACRDFGIRVAWILDAVRQFGPEAAFEVARHAARLQDRGVVGFGIGGDEMLAPPGLFREVFAFARSEGLRLTVHAGETGGAESIWGALQDLGAERIGHGLAAARDEGLIEFLVERQVPLEVCLTSNLRTGCVARLDQHPLRYYFDRGVLLTLNTDDPGLFETDLEHEYSLAQEVFGFTNQDLKELARSSFRSAFLSPVEKAAFLDAFADSEEE